MNKIFSKILILGFVFVCITGCADFLTKEVLGYSTEENFFDTRYKLQAALNATYDVLQTGTFADSEWRFGEATADNVWASDEGLTSQMGQLVNFRFTTSNTFIQSRYSIMYEGIHRANQVIANADRVRIADNEYATYQNIREILAQAKFLRAFFYFNLVKTFGGVPIRPEIETVDNMVIPRSSAEEVYAYIEKDLREAAIMLPARFVGPNAGKASSGTCIALLMKALMYQATPGERSEKWEEMVRLGEFFIDDRSMNFGEILKFNTYQEDWESLRKRLWFKPQELNSATDPYETTSTRAPQLATAYSLEYKDNDGITIGYLGQWFLAGEFCKGSIFEITFKEMADGRGTNDGTSLFTDLYSTSPVMWCRVEIQEALFGADPRGPAGKCMIGHHEFAPDGETCETPPSTILSLKWYTPIKERPQYSGDNGKNWRYMRYADVVLMYAEALNECGFGERSLAELNKNKAMANTITGSSALYPAGGYGQTRDNIWTERRLEFCYEFDRFFDLVRQKRAAAVIRAFGAGKVSKRGYYFREGVNEVFPIPQREIDLSNGVIEQNPGY